MAQRLPSDSFINNGGISVAPSSVGGSATGDWYTFQQHFNFSVERQNYIVPTGSYYDQNTVSGVTISTDYDTSTTHNRLLVTLNCVVQADIEYNATYNSAYRTEQDFTVDLALSAGSMSNGIGSVQTAIIGQIKRLARKDSSGNILDPEINQQFYGIVFPIFVRSGAHINSIDTANEIIMQVANYIKQNLAPDLNLSLVHA